MEVKNEAIADDCEADDIGVGEDEQSGENVATLVDGDPAQHSNMVKAAVVTQCSTLLFVSLSLYPNAY